MKTRNAFYSFLYPILISVFLLSFFPSSIFASEYILNLSVPQASSQSIKAPDGNDYLSYSFSGGSFTIDIGKPKLPVIYEKVAIPDDAKDVRVEVVSAKAHQEKLSNHIYPVPKPVVKKDSSGITYMDEEFFIDEGFYKNNKVFYPDLAVIKEVADMRGLRFAIVEIRPLQYNPSRKLLNITEEITLKITWASQTNSINTEKLEEDSFLKPLFRKLHNFGDAETIKSSNMEPDSLMKIFIEDAGGGGGGGGAPNHRPTDLLTATYTDYLIITANDFYNSPSIDLLANHRASAAGGGYQVSIVRLQDIYNTDFPDKNGTETNDQLVKMFIKYAYDHWNGSAPPLKFILLVGDAITDSNNLQVDAPYLVPTHISTEYAFGSRIATDYWYSCLGGNYPDYLNDTFDTAGDIAIGRFAVRTQQELERVTSKTINYETVFSDTPGDWRSKDVLLSGFGSDETSFLVDTRNFINSLRGNYLIPNYQEVPVEYRDDASKYSDDAAGSLAFREKIKSYFNEGSLMLIEASHGTGSQWHDGDHGFIFEASDIDLLTNTTMLPIVVNLACFTGIFDHQTAESLGESFLKNSDAGAIAFVGSSRSENTVAFELILGFSRELFDNNLRIGDALLNGKVDSALIYRLLNNLLGDPALDVARVKEQSTKPELSGSIHYFEIAENSVTFNLTIINSGLGDASNVSLDLYEGYPDQGGTRIPVVINPVPVVAGQEELSYEIEVPLWNPDYTGNIYLVIDGSDEIDELDEDNNISRELFYFWVSPFKVSYITGGGYEPAISGAKIVWTDHALTNNSLYLYDLGPDGISGTADDSEIVRLTEDLSYKYEAAIFGNKIVWTDERNGSADIYFYDLGSDGIFGTADDSGEVQLTTDASNQSHASISGNKMVWLDYRNGYYEIYFYDLGPDGTVGTADDSGEVRLTAYSSNKNSPLICGNKIIWADHRHGPSELYLYDLGPDGIFGTADDSGEVRITTNLASSKYGVSFSGNKIVWSAYIGMYQAVVYMYDLGLDGIFGTADDSGVVRLTPGTTAYPHDTSISGNKIIWRHISKELYLYDLGPDGIFGTVDDLPEKRVAVDTQDFWLDGHRVIYSGNDNSIYLIDVNSPPVMSPVGSKVGYARLLLSFRVLGSDPDGDTLIYSADGLPPGATFNAATQTFSWVPQLEDVGIYYVTFTATDPSGAFDSEEVQITVKKKKIDPGPFPLPHYSLGTIDP